MSNRIKLSVVTPNGTVFEKSVEYVSIPTSRGPVGVLANHAPMLCAAQKGTLRCRIDSGEEKLLSIDDGVASVENNVVTLLISDAYIQ